MGVPHFLLQYTERMINTRVINIITITMHVRALYKAAVMIICGIALVGVGDGRVL